MSICDFQSCGFGMSESDQQYVHGIARRFVKEGPFRTVSLRKPRTLCRKLLMRSPRPCHILPVSKLLGRMSSRHPTSWAHIISAIRKDSWLVIPFSALDSTMLTSG